jgi:hypothetical protein
MKKILIVFLILFILSSSATAARNWEKQYTLDNLFIDSTANGELWETIDKADRINTALVYNKVKIGQPLLISYSRYGANAEISEYYKNEEFIKENQRFYPTGSYLKMVYMGQDAQNNIRLKVYDHYYGNEKKLYKRINSLIEEDYPSEEDKEGMLERTGIESEKKLKEVIVKIITLDSDYYYFDLDTDSAPYDDFQLSSNKILKFWDESIPPIKIKTNMIDSTIKVEIVN